MPASVPRPRPVLRAVLMLAACAVMLLAVVAPGTARAQPPAPVTPAPAPPDPVPPDPAPLAPAPPAPAPSAPAPPAPAPPDPVPPDPGPPRPDPVPPRPPGAGIRAPGADYAWPLHPAPDVGTPFRRPAFRFGPGHRGADLVAAPGQAVLAAREGLVVFAGPVAGRGVVSVDHPDGLRTTYEPVTPSVRTGTRVTAGDPLGVLEAGHRGCPAPACLHWGVRRGKVDYLDPLVLLRPARLRLLPWDGLGP